MKESPSEKLKDEEPRMDNSIQKKNEKPEDDLISEENEKSDNNGVYDGNEHNNNEEDHRQDDDDDFDDLNDDDFVRELTRLIGESVLIITEATQLNLLGQTFRPIFCGPIVDVGAGHLTIDPVTIKILNAPFFQFPTPLSIPLEKIAQLTPGFDCNTRFPLT